MIEKNTLVLYKKQPAIITEVGEKYTIEYLSVPATSTGKKAQYSTQKVRDKDITELFPNVKVSLESIINHNTNSTVKEGFSKALEEAYELLLSDEETASSSFDFSTLVEYSIGELTDLNSFAFFDSLTNDIHFKYDENTKLFSLRTEDEIKQIQQKNYEKEHEAEIKAGFINRLKQKKINLPEDTKFMQEIEALALGKTDKSKFLKEAGIKETPEKAHKTLLDTGFWHIGKNPYPSRFGLSMQSATETLASPPEEERTLVNHIAYAIDNIWSTDPDDAIGFDGEYVWIHIADPASSVLPDSKIDIKARNRGATLYIPEGASRMLAEESIEDYALGLCEYSDGCKTGKLSNALSFKIKLDDKGNITETEVLKSKVFVERLSYEKADELKETPELKPLFEIAKKNETRRKESGGVFINLPEVHIDLEKSEDSPIPNVKILAMENKPKSCDVVREFMLLAGEAAAKYAFKNQIAFPFISQPSPDIPKDLPEGLAGQYRLRRSMRSRSVGVSPAAHAGLGLGMYSQVTSPLRRYSDLIAHQQLRAHLNQSPLLDKDTMLERISAGDAAMSASIKAERSTRLHWTIVYLLQNPDWTGKGVVVELRGKQAVILIPELAQETIIIPKETVALNDELIVKAGKINLPELELSFFEV